MMRKSIYLILAFVFSFLSTQAQITPTAPQKTGIQTRRPSETLDVNGTVRLRNRPDASNSGEIYNGATNQSTAFTPTHIVTADENGVLGAMPMDGGGDVNNWVILPALHLPTTASEITSALSSFIAYDSSKEVFTVKNAYWARNQFSYSPTLEPTYTTAHYFVKSPSASNDIGYIGYKTQNKDINYRYSCYYYVTYYDNDVFTDVSMDYFGALTYKVKPNAVVTSKTYMTIVAQIPQL